MLNITMRGTHAYFSSNWARFCNTCFGSVQSNIVDDKFSQLFSMHYITYRGFCALVDQTAYEALIVPFLYYLFLAGHFHLKQYISVNVQPKAQRPDDSVLSYQFHNYRVCSSRDSNYAKMLGRSIGHPALCDMQPQVRQCIDMIILLYNQMYFIIKSKDVGLGIIFHQGTRNSTYAIDIIGLLLIYYFIRSYQTRFTQHLGVFIAAFLCQLNIFQMLLQMQKEQLSEPSLKGVLPLETFMAYQHDMP